MCVYCAKEEKSKAFATKPLSQGNRWTATALSEDGYGVSCEDTHYKETLWFFMERSSAACPGKQIWRQYAHNSLWAYSLSFVRISASN